MMHGWEASHFTLIIYANDGRNAGFERWIGTCSAGLPMSALGQKRTSQQVRAMSALPPKADMVQHDRDVRFVPKADIPATSALR
jgi:hypothetical protein